MHLQRAAGLARDARAVPRALSGSGLGRETDASSSEDLAAELPNASYDLPEQNRDADQGAGFFFKIAWFCFAVANVVGLISPFLPTRRLMLRNAVEHLNVLALFFFQVGSAIEQQDAAGDDKDCPPSPIKTTPPKVKREHGQ